METNEVGEVISYEEYHPFGTSAYRVARSGTNLSLKRYRFTNKERDDETGLYYFGVRYYAAWLGRWTSSDPGGFVDGLNMYVYVRNNPVNGVDILGYETDPPPYTLQGENAQGGSVYKDNRYDGAFKVITSEGGEYFKNSEGRFWAKPDGKEWVEQDEGLMLELGITEMFDVTRASDKIAILSNIKTKPFIKKPNTWVTRKDHPTLSEKIQKNGFESKARQLYSDGRTTIAEHVLGEKLNGSNRISVSENFKGSGNHEGTLWGIDLEGVQNEGYKYTNHQEVIKAVETYAHENNITETKRITDWHEKGGGSPIESEGLIEGAVPNKFIYTEGQMHVTEFMKNSKFVKGGNLLGIIVSGVELTDAAMESWNTSDPKPFAAEGVRQAGGWGASIAAGSAAFWATGALSLTGPQGVAFVLGSTLLAGYLGYQGADAAADHFIHKN
jgi:RHS repeat-associated protein